MLRTVVQCILKNTKTGQGATWLRSLSVNRISARTPEFMVLLRGYYQPSLRISSLLIVLMNIFSAILLPVYRKARSHLFAIPVAALLLLF